VEQFDFFSDACRFFSVAQVKWYNFDAHNNQWRHIQVTQNWWASISWAHPGIFNASYVAHIKH